uniref:Uncharacterized protein n=1 Tax=Plectus sambesii TaxID=2011161 RepID=A0A914WLB2_9BILA
MSASIEKTVPQKEKERMSPFRMIFSRKKRINGTKSIDDIKSNGKAQNGHSRDVVNGLPDKSQPPPPAVTKATTLPSISKETKTKTKDHKEQGKKQLLIGQEKAKSMEALHADDTNYLTEALQTLGDEQPRVARSIPKHAPNDNSYQNFADRSLQNCIYGHEVYEGMVADSLKVCDLLQHHLDDLVLAVRKSPPRGADDADGAPAPVAVQNGH